MPDDPFDPSSQWNVDPPFFVRKIDAKWHWHGRQENGSDRIQCILENVLVPDSAGRISTYWVGDSNDLRRVVVGLDANRSNPGKMIRFVAMLPDEIGEFKLEPTEGLTECRGANALHRDIVVDQSARLPLLAERLVRSGRQDRVFQKKHLEHGRLLAQKEFCTAFRRSYGCACDRRIDRRIAYWLQRGRAVLLGGSGG